MTSVEIDIKLEFEDIYFTLNQRFEKCLSESKVLHFFSLVIESPQKFDRVSLIMSFKQNKQIII